jgi:hypothetical protein
MLISFMYQRRGAQETLAFRTFFRQDMSTTTLVTLKKPARRAFKPLGRASIGFQFWHFRCPNG